MDEIDIKGSIAHTCDILHKNPYDDDEVNNTPYMKVVKNFQI